VSALEINVDGASDAADHVVNIATNANDLAEIAMGIGGATVIIFVLFVLPLWLFLHYRSKARKLAPVLPAPVVSNSDLHELARLAERVENRLDALETLMDADQPGWRR
jgi:phage shock protein B